MHITLFETGTLHNKTLPQLSRNVSNPFFSSKYSRKKFKLKMSTECCYEKNVVLKSH